MKEKNPVIITVYDRIICLKECIDALLLNEEAKYTTVFISSDAFYKIEDKEKVEEIREYILSINGFREVVAIFHENNVGSFFSGYNAIELVLEKYPAFIFLEDDVVVSPFFLEYMNASLDTFECDDDVYFVCSYIWPKLNINRVTNKDIFLWRSYCPWGMASWKAKWNRIDFNLNNFNYFFDNQILIDQFNKIDPNTINILKSDVAGEVVAADARISLNLFLNKKMSIFPSRTMCVNRGHNGKGLHGSTQKKYMDQELDNFRPIVDSTTKLNEKIQEFIYNSKFTFIRYKIYNPLVKIKTVKKMILFLRRVFKI